MICKRFANNENVFQGLVEKKKEIETIRLSASDIDCILKSRNGYIVKVISVCDWRLPCS
jgi:hypothetical protein